MRKGKIDILMATYNGAKYLPQQLCSIVNQSFKDWTLYIHDDGSTDDTVSVIKRFASLDERIVLVEDGLSYHSPGLNFLHLLDSSTAPFAIFCDQDDIWLENKLQKMYDCISLKDNAKPQAVYSNSYVYDVEAASISGFATICRPRTLKDILFMNSGVQGCAIMFNALLRDICRRIPAHVSMHDHVVTLAALTFGGFSYVDSRLMLYRRHTATVTGKTYKNKAEKVADFFSSDKTVLSKDHYLSIRSFYDCHKDDIPSDKKKIYLDFFRFTDEGRIKRIFHVIKGNYRLYGKLNILIFKMIIRPLL